MSFMDLISLIRICEGEVYIRLLQKMEEQRKALGDGVFDVLGKLFQETSRGQI